MTCDGVCYHMHMGTGHATSAHTCAKSRVSFSLPSSDKGLSKAACRTNNCVSRLASARRWAAGLQSWWGGERDLYRGTDRFGVGEGA